jgi:hypothetical protein
MYAHMYAHFTKVMQRHRRLEQDYGGF